MASVSGTEALRASATRWTLAGDKQLLQLLQDIHEKVVTKCKESNALLEEMTRSLDEASIDVQSVNNKFMSLSNSQFVESRVYGDDADVTKEPEPQKEEPKPPDSPLNRTKRSLQVLEDMHDSYEIYDDTDSDSDSDNCVSRTVLKPKDVYTHRPLPFIIGSYNWRTKWHVGLIHESSDSDEDSEVVYNDGVQKPQYSETESEREETKERSRTISASSGSDRLPTTAPSKLPTVQSPADIAAELARRLGNVGQLQMPSASLDSEPPQMSTGKIYRPEQPTTATIFPDEPPPLDQTVSDVDYEEEEEDDIFAELHRNGQKVIARDEQRQSTSQPVSKPKTNLFEDDSESELFVPEPQIRIPVEQKKQDETNNAIKKPIGGISLFGNNKGAESIGAAILKRNLRKSSTSDDESDSDEVQNRKEETKTEPIKEKSEIRTKEKDIIDNLFPKPQNISKTKVKTHREITKPEVIKKEDKKVDLFSDNLFDDIDDIFSSNIVLSTPTKNAQKPKSLFDDDDDLFAEVSESKPAKVDSKNDGGVRKKGLFDSDDELFSETPDRNSNKDILSNTTDAMNVSKIKESKVKSIFDDSSDDDIFDKIVTTKPIRETTIISDHTLKPKDNEDNVIKSDKNFNIQTKLNEENIFDDKNEQTKVITTDFDGDNVNNNSNLTSNDRLTPSIVKNVKKDSENNTKHVAFQSPSLFDDNDDIDNIFFKDKQNVTNAGSSQQNILSTLHENNTLLVEKDKNNMDLDSPIITTDVKSTSRVLAEETPYKRNEGDSKRTVDVYDSSLEDDFEQDFDDYDDHQPKTLTEKRTKNETNPVLVQELPKYLESPTKDQFNEIPSKVDEIVQEQEKTDKDIDFIHETKSKESIDEQQSTSNIFDKDIEQSIESKDTIKTEELTTSFYKSKSNIKSSDFNKLFTEEPPAFEKPKESKKSKNVNALFDDDSDDEALFFKKSDAPLVDEKPESFPTTVDTNTNLFGIFLDEPPDLNVDLTQKEDELSRNKLESLPTDSVEDDFLFKLNETEKIVENTKIIKAAETKDSDTKKPIGKLKMNLNINVNTLLPGYSPKKTIRKIEQIEPENSINKSTEELDSKMTSHYKTDEKKVIPRSASFEDDTEAKVLDNKLSKQRPRIQVKRRPSTRRARHEAVRKTIIDINDDSTDNSSSIDDYSAPKPEITSKHVISTSESKENDTIQNKSIYSDNSKLDGLVTKAMIPKFSDSNEYPNPRKDVKTKVVYILNDEDIFTNTDVVKNTLGVETEDSLDKNNKYNTASTVEKTEGSYDSVDSKPFDLLSEPSKASDKDNNIFKDQPEDDFSTKLPDKEQYKKPILNIVDDANDDESLFKGLSGSDLQPKLAIKQNETVKSETQKPKKSLFDDLSEDEDELFKPKTSKATKSKNIFGSDSDDDIFVSKKKETKTEALKVEKREKHEVKKSLFSDDDDDDDLFGANKSSVDIKAHSRPTNSKESNKTKIALEDPLSMLDE